MTQTASTIAKFENFVAAYSQLVAEFQNAGDPTLSAIAESWASSLSQLRVALSQSPPPVKPSVLFAGLEQALLETPTLVSDLPEKPRRLALAALHRITNSHLPGLFEKQRKVIDEVIVRGKIKTEKEWCLLRHCVDEIESENSQSSELSRLYRMIEEYESAA